MIGCELAFLGGCGGPEEDGHLFNKSRLRNVKGALAYCEKHGDVLLVRVCHNHNTTRAHDEKRWRTHLVQSKVTEHGPEHVDEVFEGLRALYKQPPMDMRLAAFIASPFEAD